MLHPASAFRSRGRQATSSSPSLAQCWTGKDSLELAHRLKGRDAPVYRVSQRPPPLPTRVPSSSKLREIRHMKTLLNSLLPLYADEGNWLQVLAFQ